MRALSPAESLNWEDLCADWTGYFKEKTFFTYHRCLDCGLLHDAEYLTDRALNELYGQMPNNTAGVDEAALTKAQWGYFHFAVPRGTFPGDFLELGPDIGLLTQFAARATLSGAQLWLYEPNEAVHGILQARTQGRDHQIRGEMEDFSAVPDGTIGLCVLIHVMDHLAHPKEVVSQLARKLRPDGRMLIVTHDERSLLARILGRRWLAFCLQHPQLFNRQSTRRFLQECGLEVIETRKSYNYMPVLYLLKHLLYALGVRSAAGWQAKSFVLPLRLGNIMTVARPAQVASAAQ
jgi:SAM-dependent methyltransferase